VHVGVAPCNVEKQDVGSIDFLKNSAEKGSAMATAQAVNCNFKRVLRSFSFGGSLRELSYRILGLLAEKIPMLIEPIFGLILRLIFASMLRPSVPYGNCYRELAFNG
jgi:hypothetical protein